MGNSNNSILSNNKIDHSNSISSKNKNVNSNLKSLNVKIENLNLISSNKKIENINSITSNNNNIYSIKGNIKIPDIAFKNANYFCPSSQTKHKYKESQNFFKEGKVTKTKNELRVLISNPEPDSYEIAQGQICGLFEDEYFNGSGTVCVFGKQFKNNKFFLLTCAHNFVQVDKGLGKKIKYMDSMRYDYSKTHESKFNTSYVSNISIFPGYLENPDIIQGFDIAIGLLDGEFNNAPFSKNSQWSTIDDEECKNGDVICVIGYPGEYNEKLYKMEGTIFEIRKLENGRKLILYNDIDTSPGQSGSPVLLKKNNKWFIIGIHVGYDRSLNVNIATAITNDVYDWVEDQMNKLWDY